jgi:transcriptional regulator with XRE-family HTH domain
MKKPRHDWFLKEWLKTTGKKQADVARDLDWNKAKVSLTLHGKQAYDRDDINEMSAYLNIAPYELLMHPQDAMALRRLRQDALRIAADQGPEDSREDEGEQKFVSLN